MFQDRQRELERLQQELLEEEEYIDDESEEDEPYPLSPADYDDTRIYTNHPADVSPEELSDELLLPPRRSMRGLVIAALLITAGVLMLLAWLLLRMRGMI